MAASLVLLYAARAIGAAEGLANRPAALITLLFAVIVFRFFTRPADPGRADLSLVNPVETFTPPKEFYSLHEGPGPKVLAVSPQIHIVTTTATTFHLFKPSSNNKGDYFFDNALAISRVLSRSFMEFLLSGAALPFATANCSFALPLRR